MRSFFAKPRWIRNHTCGGSLVRLSGRRSRYASGLHGHFLIGPKAIGLDYSFVAIEFFQNGLFATGTVIIEEV